MEISKAEERAFLAIEAMESTIATMQKTADDFAKNSALALQQYSKGSVFAKESFEATVRKEVENYARSARNAQQQWQQEIMEKVNTNISKQTHIKTCASIIACVVIAIVCLQIYASSFQSDIVAARQELAAIQEEKKLAQNAQTIMEEYGGRYVKRQNNEIGLLFPETTKAKRLEDGKIFIMK